MFSSLRQWIGREKQIGLEAGNGEGEEGLNHWIPWAIKAAKAFAALVLIFVALFMWSNINRPLSLPTEAHQPSQVVVDIHGAPLAAKPNQRGFWRYPVKLEQISPMFVEALIAQQDPFFYYHFGFNPISVAWNALASSVSDDSNDSNTLTIKTAKVLYPQEGSWMNVVRAVQLELKFDKDEILEMYLNNLHMGPQMEGIEAASYQFFDKSSKQLERHEIALLLAVAKYPKRYRLDKFAHRARDERDQMLKEFGDQGLWDDKQIRTALSMPVEPVSLELPRSAAQFLAHVAPFNSNEIITSSIEPVIQAELERYSQEFADKQVNGSTMAMVMMNNDTKEVLAYVGNSPGHDTTDMIQAIRSPGDMLKPMLFGKAVDERLIHSESLLADVPRRGYLRDVADGLDEFVGPVSAAEALQLSLNVPFIQLIENYGARKFVKSLKSVDQPIELSDFGLSPRVLLGEAETNLEQMVELYSALGTDGRVSHMAYPSQQVKDAKPYLSEEAAWITWSSMAHAELPDYVVAAKPATLAWKAGNGWAGRDNWAIGVAPNFTLGIWVGVHDDIYSSPVSGKADALNALVSITSALESYYPLGQLARPRGVKQEEICWPDGRSRGVNVYGCDRRKTAWTKNGQAPQTLMAGQNKGWFRSQRGMYVDKVTEKRLSRGCYKNRAEYTTATLWPRELEQWLPDHMRRAERLPEFNDYCPNVPFEDSDLKISGIKPEQVFYRINNKRLPPLIIKAEGANGFLEWYLNGESIADGNEVELNLNRLTNGPQQLVALDERGYSMQIPFHLAKAADKPQQAPVATQERQPVLEEGNGYLPEEEDDVTL